MTEPTDGSITAPKQDKFASMAAVAAGGDNPPSMAATTTQPPQVSPKRDKFASMAAAASSAPASPPRRDKLASMASAQQQDKPNRDKFASMAASQTSTDTPSTPTPPVNQHEIIQKRMKQRDQVLEDLKQAEGWTWQLLNLASQTARSLSDLTSDKEDVLQLSLQYRETLQKIHSTLAPHSHLVVAYQNHKVDNKEEGKTEGANESQDEEKAQDAKEERIDMYAARVEMRLAQERRDVLKELLRLDREDINEGSSEPMASSEASVGDKRKRGD